MRFVFKQSDVLKTAAVCRGSCLQAELDSVCALPDVVAVQGVGNAVDIKRQPNEENIKLHGMIAICLVHFHKVFSATHNPLLLFI